MLPISVLGLPQSIEIDQRPDKKFRQGFTGAPAAAGRVRTNNTFPCSLPGGYRREASWFLIWGEGRGVSRGRAGEVALVFCPPLSGVECRGHAQYLAFAPSPSEVAVGFFWSFCIMLSIIFF